MSESFAAAGSLVVLLAWVYYAAQIFLLGAEFTKVYADERGSRSAVKAMAATKQTAAVGVPKDTAGDEKVQGKAKVDAQGTAAAAPALPAPRPAIARSATPVRPAQGAGVRARSPVRAFLAGAGPWLLLLAASAVVADRSLD